MVDIVGIGGYILVDWLVWYCV